ncbi:hypothetical protein [Frondihabitans australicus]|uniref:Htaa protein n=1 Tax=Frondihabitans australicus TaxID=386892 RepID=A0A495IBK8_9MICO|nr:hypothetical protein [Frondihabitans australicus]RKR73312.1 hypothetical protein C8E83_0404 [Frondihabitans australicus]
MRKISKAGISFVAAGLLVAGAAGVGVSQANASSAHLTAASSKIPAPAAAVPALKGGMTGVALDSNFLAALKSLGLTPSTYGSAKLNGSDITFPITGGSVVYWSPKSHYRPYVQGIIEHDGSGLNLTAGSTTVTLSNFTINPGNSILYGDVSVNGKVAVTQADLFNLYGGTLKPLQLQGDDAILTGTTVHVSADAAKLLDSTFKTTAVKSQLLVGVATITAQIK